MFSRTDPGGEPQSLVSMVLCKDWDGLQFACGSIAFERN